MARGCVHIQHTLNILCQDFDQPFRKVLGAELTSGAGKLTFRLGRFVILQVFVDHPQPVGYRLNREQPLGTDLHTV